MKTLYTLLAACTLAVGCGPRLAEKVDVPLVEKPAVHQKKNFELDRIVREADELYKRNERGGQGIPSDHEKAIPLWEKALELAPSEIHAELYQTKLITCRGTVTTQRISHAKTLAFFEKAAKVRQSAKEAFGISTPAEAKELQTRFYRDAIEQLDHIVADKPKQIASLATRGLTYVELKEWDYALADYRRVVTLKPDELTGYALLLNAHIAKSGKVFNIVEELKHLKHIDSLVRARNIAEVGIASFDKFLEMGRKTGAKSANIDIRTRPECMNAATFFYLTAAFRWNKEMKKPLSSRDFSTPLRDLLLGGSFDFSVREDPQAREQALGRFIDGYDTINKGMDNGLKRLDKLYEDKVINGNIDVLGKKEVLKALKEHYDKQATDKRKY